MAIKQQGKEREIRRALATEVKKLFDSALKEPPSLSGEIADRLSNLAEIVAIERTNVGRAAWGNREIEYVPEPESNTRVSKGLAALVRGIAALNRHSSVDESDFRDVVRV